METPTIDFATMRESCIEIYQVVSELFSLSSHIGVTISFPEPYSNIHSAKDLTSDAATKKWDGMCVFAKDLLDNKSFWEQLPNVPVTVPVERMDKIKRFTWTKEKALKSLETHFFCLGGMKTYTYVKKESNGKE